MKIFSVMDLNVAYWQVPIKESDREKSAFSFSAEKGIYEFCVMLFGLINTPSTCQCLLDSIFEGMSNISCYLDDIEIYSEDLFPHLPRKEYIVEIKKCRIEIKDIEVSVCKD